MSPPADRPEPPIPPEGGRPASSWSSQESDDEAGKMATTKPSPPEPLPFRVVGIGASAGGVEAYTRLLKALPPDTGLAYLLVPHLSPTHHSELAQLLARTAEIPVTEARDADEMQPDHLYVLPPDRVMTIADGRLRLRPRPSRDGLPTVIDACLTSLAEVWGSRAVGVVLSGTGSDGAAGLQAIKAHGGVTYAQDFASAAYESMPRNAVEAGGVDFTLPPEGIARALAELGEARGDPAPSSAPSRGGRHGLNEVTPPDEPLKAELSVPEAAALEKILELLQSATGADFRHYKRPSMTRRVRRRMAELGISDLAAYLPLLQDNPAELQALFGAVLIHVTGFFREPAMFQVLQSTVIPTLFSNRPAGTPIRVWVVGCASGEEAYSTAITFLEVGASLGREVPVRIFASDLGEDAVNTARLGRYPAAVSEDISPERLQRFFVPVEGGFQVEKRLREMCVFARQDLTRDPPFAQLDLVICRNLLIYLEPALQHRVLTVFHYALKPGGFLALGAAETIAGMDQLFAPLDRKNRVYLRRAAPSRLELDLRWSGQQRAAGSPLLPPAGVAPIKWTSAELQRAAAQALFTQYPTGSVIVNPDLEILHFEGKTTPYLAQPSGGPTVHLLRMAHPDLRLILGRLIRKAQKERREARRRGVPIKVGSQTQRVNLTVLPVPTEEAQREHCLVLFEAATRGKPEPEVSRGATSRPDSADEGSRALELEQELAETKEYLQAIIDQQDQTHAELQAAYEASLSANEEFQSTNEELESAKEELQSVNEELTTLNEQLHQRNAELSTRTAEVTSLLEAMEMPILLLNPDLRLRAFNSKAAAELRLARANVGRPISEIQSPVPLSELHALVDRALADQSIQEQQVQDKDGRWHALRLWPVLPVGGWDTAVVAALVDIGQLKQDLDRVEEARAFSEAIVETVREPLAVLDDELRTVTANRAFHAVFKTEPEAVRGNLLWELGDRELDTPEFRRALQEVQATGKPVDDQEMTIESLRIGRCIFRLSARRITQPGVGGRNILLALENVTKQREVERQMVAAGRLQAVGQLAGGIAHEINNQMTTILGFGTLMVKMGTLAEEQQADLTRIVKAARRAAEITRQLLAFSRRQILEPVIVELNALVATSESILHRLIGPNIMLEIVLGDSVGQVRVDQAQFEQVLVNLVLNARDAMPQGGRLLIETSLVTVGDTPSKVPSSAGIPQGIYARLIVSDSGVGMDPVTLGRIFEPFFTTKERGRGTGLGLASVYGTIKQSGGFVWVQSEVGRGTTFTIDLPEIVASTPVQAPPAPSTSPGGSETLLVVEDEEPVRSWIARSLTQLGYSVLEAGDGSEALRLLEQADDTVKLVVSDVLMPSMSGAALRESLAVSRPGLPVLLISAYSLDELLARGIVGRNVFVLQKPFDIAELAFSIREALDTLAIEVRPT